MAHRCCTPTTRTATWPRVNDLAAGTVSYYRYNAANQLTTAVSPSGSQSIAYDGNGNLISSQAVTANLGTTQSFLNQTFPPNAHRRRDRCVQLHHLADRSP